MPRKPPKRHMVRTARKLAPLRINVTEAEMKKLCKHQRYTQQIIERILGADSTAAKLFKLCERDHRKIIAQRV